MSKKLDKTLNVLGYIQAIIGFFVSLFGGKKDKDTEPTK